MIIVNKFCLFLFVVVFGLVSFIGLSIYYSNCIVDVVSYLLFNMVFSLLVLGEVGEVVFCIWVGIWCYVVVMDVVMCVKLEKFMNINCDKVIVVFDCYEKEDFFDVIDCQLLQVDCDVFVDYEKSCQVVIVLGIEGKIEEVLQVVEYQVVLFGDKFINVLVVYCCYNEQFGQ